MNDFQNNGFDSPFSSGQSSGSFGGNSFGSFSDMDAFQSFGGKNSAPPPPKKYGLHWIQTLLVLFVTTVVSYVFTGILDIRYAANPHTNPKLILNNALFLAILAGSILMSVFLLELATSAMTPHFGRNLQFMAAVITIVICALIGGLSEMFFITGYVEPLIAPTPTPLITATPMPTATPTPTPTPIPQSEIIVFALDKSYSMQGDSNSESVHTLKTLIREMDSDAKVGLIVFDDTIIETVPLKHNTDAHQTLLFTAASCDVQGGTEFTNVMNEALRIVQAAALPDDAAIKLVFITDGSGGNVDHYVSNCQGLNIQVSCVMIGSAFRSDLYKVITETGGIFVSANSPADILDHTKAIISATALPLITPSPKPIPTPSPTPVPRIGNMLYVTPDSDLYLAVMLILFGLVLGIALTLMLSLEGQLRIQLFLSPLMGLCAFLLIHYKVVPVSNYWMIYPLFGIVLMRRNSSYFSSVGTTKKQNPPPNPMNNEPFQF